MTIHITDNTGAGNTHLITVCYRLDELFLTHSVTFFDFPVILTSEILLHSSHTSTTCCMLIIEHDPPITWRPHVTDAAADITFMTDTLLVASRKSLATFSSREAHSAFDVALRLCACFVAAPTALISVKFGMETVMDIC